MSDPRTCPKCQGTGWLLEDAGGSQVAKRCGCFGDRIKHMYTPQGKPIINERNMNVLKSILK